MSPAIAMVTSTMGSTVTVKSSAAGFELRNPC